MGRQGSLLSSELAPSDSGVAASLGFFLGGGDWKQFPLLACKKGLLSHGFILTLLIFLFLLRQCFRSWVVVQAGLEFRILFS